jgi:hypothetical protein
MTYNPSAQTTSEVRGDGNIGETPFSDSVHHAYVCAQEACVTDADRGEHAYSFSTYDSTLQELRNHGDRGTN